MDLDQTQAIYDLEEDVFEEEQNEEEKSQPKKKEAAHLKVFSQQGFKETIFTVFQGDNFIGRDGKCNITIPIKALSKKHACIEVQRDLHLIHDCESKNKTKKGKSFLKPTIRYELRHGDMLTLGDVKCQYLVEQDKEELEGDETGSETGSESMLMEVNTGEEQDNGNVQPSVIDKEAAETSVEEQKAQGSMPPELSKAEEEAYAADTDSDTDEERPLVTATVAKVLYSSEDERETPARHKIVGISSKQNSSMEGQTLAFGLGSPDHVFRNRESSGSASSFLAKTGSLPPTLMLSSESDIQSDGKDLSSDNKQLSPKQTATRGSGIMQPTCAPTLLYGSESDDGSPIKRPRKPQMRASDKQHPTCEATLLYGSDSEDGSPVKRPRHPGASSVPLVLDESDSDMGTNKAPQHVNGSAVVPSEENLRGQVLEANAPLPCAEMSSTDDEERLGAATNERQNNLQNTTASEDPSLRYTTEKSVKGERHEDDNHMDSDVYGEDDATQPYVADSNFESESEPIPFMGRNMEDETDSKPPGEHPDMEATQAYWAKDKEEEQDSDASADSQPLPLGSTAVVDACNDDDVTETLACGFEATQAYIVTKKDNDTDDGDNRVDISEKAMMQLNDLQATQAYGLGYGGDDVTDDNEEEVVREIRKEKMQELSKLAGKQPTISYGLEATQAYGAYEAEETDDEDAADQNKSTKEVDQGNGNKVAATCGLPETLPYRGGDNGSDDDDDVNEENNGKDDTNLKPLARLDNQDKLAHGLEETQAYSAEHNDADSAPSGMIEATQAYGIEEPSDEELETVTMNEQDEDEEVYVSMREHKSVPAEKTLAISESCEDINVEVKETPAPKSRRTKRGKVVQDKSVSILETPLNKTSSVGKRRRGRRKKEFQSVTVTDTSQVVEPQGQEETVEDQLETLVRATPAKGRWNGKGRGKKNQIPATRDVESVSVGDSSETLSTPASSESSQSRKRHGRRKALETQAQEGPVECQPETLAEATPAKGRGRGKARGNKAKTPSAKEPTAEVVPGTRAGNKEELHRPGSTVVVPASEGKGRGRQGRGKRPASPMTEFESSQDLSETLSNSGSIEGSNTKKGRGRQKEVEETPAKTIWQRKEAYVSHSPSLHQVKQSGESNPKVIFTGLVDKQGEKVVRGLGGQLVNDIHSCTHLVTDKVRRTVKFLCGLSRGLIIVQPSWLEACKKAKSFVDTSPFLVKDEDAEKQFKFDLQRSHEVACRQGLLEGYKVHVTKKVKPEPSQMKDIIQSSKGEFLSSMPRRKGDRVFVIACEEDRMVCKKPLEAGIPIVSAEVLLTGILRQELDLEQHKLFAENINEVSQDMLSGSKLSKRRREPSEAGTSTSNTAEAKASATKRRKR